MEPIGSSRGWRKKVTDIAKVAAVVAVAIPLGVLFCVTIPLWWRHRPNEAHYTGMED